MCANGVTYCEEAGGHVGAWDGACPVCGAAGQVPPFAAWFRSLGLLGRLHYRAQGAAEVFEERVLPHLPRRVRRLWFGALIALDRRRRRRCGHGSWGRYSAGGLEVCARCGAIRSADGGIVGG